jgi:hypothetical protein
MSKEFVVRNPLSLTTRLRSAARQPSSADRGGKVYATYLVSRYSEERVFSSTPHALDDP